MRAGVVMAAVLLAGCGSGGSSRGTGSPGGGWTATDACALLDKAKVAAAAGSPVKATALSGVTAAHDGMAALSTCIYTLEDGASVGVLTREAPDGSTLAEALASAKGPEAQALGMSFEDVAGVGKAALWNDRMHSLQVFYDDRRYAAINLMMEPKGTDAKAVTVALGKALGG